MFAPHRIGVIVVLLLMCPALPKLKAETAPDKPATTTTDVDHRVQELEKQVQELRAQLAALTQASASAARAAIPAPAAAVSAGATATAAVPAGAVQQAVSAPPASDPLSGVSSVLGGAFFTGLVDTYYSYNPNQPANRTSGLRLFDSSSNQFALNVIELGLVKTPDVTSRLGYNVTLGFGNAMNVINSGDPSFLQYLKEAYLSYLVPAGKGLQVDVGKFVTSAGFEVIESNANWNYSRGLLFNYAIPFYHFGMRAKYAFNDKYSLTGFVMNGWNNVVASNTGKTGGLSFAWAPAKKVSITETWLGGPGAVALTGPGGAIATDGGNWRNLLDTVITYTPRAKLLLATWGDYGRSEGFTGFRKSVEWSGLAGYAKYQFHPRYAIATRYEYYSDPDGVTTGGFQTVNGSAIFVPTRQHINEVTGTVEARIAQHLIARTEFRHDVSNQPVFLKGNTPVLGQSTVAAGLIFVMEPAK
jgi:hypothetical protein